MKFNLHHKIAAVFGYEIIRARHAAYRDINTHLITLFKLLNINCVLDVGANMGQYSRSLRNAGYQGLIISFEPIRECYDFLKQQEDETWKIYPYALGNESKLMQINITNKTVFSSLLKPNDYSDKRFEQSARVKRTENVEIKKLDNIFDEIITFEYPRIFLKLDTQGYDLEVLKGAGHCLQQIYGLQTEISCKAIYQKMPTHIESLKYIDELGYEITDIYPLSHDKQDMSLLEFDCVFKKRNV